MDQEIANKYKKSETKPLSNFEQIGLDVGTLVTEKNKAYGKSFSKAGLYLKLLYPNGITLDSYDDMLTLVRMFDKSVRIATDRDAFGEDPFQDIVGYGLLAMDARKERKGHEKSCG